MCGFKIITPVVQPKCQELTFGCFCSDNYYLYCACMALKCFSFENKCGNLMFENIKLSVSTQIFFPSRSLTYLIRSHTEVFVCPSKIIAKLCSDGNIKLTCYLLWPYILVVTVQPELSVYLPPWASNMIIVFTPTSWLYIQQKQGAIHTCTLAEERSRKRSFFWDGLVKIVINKRYEWMMWNFESLVIQKDG